MAKITIGLTAPAFSLLNQEGKKISLKDFKGKKNVLLYFYPKAMTPGCTVQACGLRDTKTQLAKYNTVAIGISADEPERLLKFREKEDLNFELLSDPEHVVIKKYGVWGKKKFMGREFMGILRTTFLIGKNGKILHITDKVNTKTHHQDMLMLLKELN